MDNRATKRPRPVLSCLQCRNRKLKCDRSKPCEQCVKAGRPENCTFADGHDPPPADFHGVPSERASDDGNTGSQTRKRPHMGSPEETDGSHRKSDNVTMQVEDLLSRVQSLEDRLSFRPALNLDSIPKKPSSASKASFKYLEKMDLDAYRYRYRGQHHRNTITQHFGQIKPFIQKALADPRLGSIVGDVMRLQKSFAKQHNSYSSQPVPDVKSALAGMVELLPTQFVCDMLVDAYFTHWEKTLRVLHVPTFRREYNAFWEGENRTVNISPGFVPQLLAILVISFRMHRESHAFLDRKFAYSCYAMLRAWQNQLTGRERSFFSNLQAATLVVVASLIMPYGFDRMWMETGFLVRYAMTFGLHIEPSKYDSISVFHGQIRRRLWATILELDIQTSLISGMPTTVRAGDYSTQPPENIDDVDLVEDMKQMPKPQAWNEWTPTLPQIVLAKSATWRLRAADMVARQAPIENDQEEMSCISHGITENQEAQPLCLRLEIESLVRTRHPDRLASLILLDLFNKRALIAMWRPMFFHNRWQTKMMLRHNFVNYVLSVLEYHNNLNPDSKDVGLDPQLPLAIIQNMCKHDLISAAFSVCLEVKCMNELLSNPDQDSPTSLCLLGETASNGASNQPSTMKSKAALVRAIKSTLDLLIRGIADHGCDVTDVMLLWGILASVRTINPQASTYVSMLEDFVRTVNACRQRLQPDKDLAKVSTAETTNAPVGYKMKYLSDELGSREPLWGGPPTESSIDFEAGITGFENFFSLDDMDFDFGDWQQDSSWL